MHSDTIPGDTGGTHRMHVREARSQSGGHAKLPHVITGLLAIVASLVIGHFSHLLQGQQGPVGTTSVITKTAGTAGFCAYFGPDSTGRIRFQVSAPKADSSGPWCPKGRYISVVLPAK